VQVHPPLHFFNGGIKAMIAVLREHVNLTKSATDANTYVVVAPESSLQLPPPLASQLSADSAGGAPVERAGDASSNDSPPVTGEVCNGGAGCAQTLKVEMKPKN
jgi:hypothetical protein